MCKNKNIFKARDWDLGINKIRLREDESPMQRWKIKWSNLQIERGNSSIWVHKEESEKEIEIRVKT